MGAEDIVKFVMGELGFVKGYAPSAETEPSITPETKLEDDPIKRLEDLQAEKKKAVADEDFKRAKELKKGIEKLQTKMKDYASSAETEPSITPETKPEDDPIKRLEDLQAEKKKAVADEDFQRARELRKEIEKLQTKMKKEDL